MTMEEYANWAASVAKVTTDPGKSKLSYLGLGLPAEAGEVADVIKKWLRGGKLDGRLCSTSSATSPTTGPASVLPPVKIRPICWRKAGRRSRAG